MILKWKILKHAEMKRNIQKLDCNFASTQKE